MRFRLWTFVVSAALLIVLFGNAAKAVAVFEGGNEFYTRCNNKNNPYDQGYCLGFIIAVLDAMTTNPLEGFSACFPERITKGQARDVVFLYFQKNPERRHFAAESSVARALSEAFPCP